MAAAEADIMFYHHCSLQIFAVWSHRCMAGHFPVYPCLMVCISLILCECSTRQLFSANQTIKGKTEQESGPLNEYLVAVPLGFTLSQRLSGRQVQSVLSLASAH
jgi:hypothetical protein